MGETWGSEGPPDEAYSRVTNPERFRPLHDYGERLLARLETEYDVVREETTEPEAERRPSLTRPPVRLVPANLSAAPFTMSFLSFPGLDVRVGYWLRTSFPDCGCDACDETVEGAQEELERLVRTVTRGTVREYLDIPLVGGAHLGQEVRGPDEAGSGWTLISRAEARRLRELAGGRTDIRYEPWPRRDAAG